MADPWADFADAPDTGADPWADFADAEAQPAGKKKKEKKPGFFQKFGSGLSEIERMRQGLMTGDVETIKDIPQAAATFGKGATRGVESLGRGIMSPLGDVDSAAVAGLSELGDLLSGKDTGSFDQKRMQDIANKHDLKSEQGIANFLGELYGYGRAATMLKSMGMKGLVSQGATLGGAEAALSGGDVGDIATGAGIGAGAGLAGKALEKPLSAVGTAIATRIQDAMRRGSAAVSKRAVRAVAARTKASPDDVEAAIKGWTEVHGKPPSMAEIGDKATIEKFADIAKDRKTFGDVFRTAEEEAILARPETMRAATAAGGDVLPAVEARAAMGEAGDRAAAGIRATQQQAKTAANAAAREEQRIVREGSAELINDQNALLTRAKQELGDNLNIADDVRTWGNRVMRDSGLADQRVPFNGKDLKEMVSEDRLKGMLNSMRDDLPVDQRAPVSAILDAIDNNSNVSISVDILDNLRQRLNDAYKGDGTRVALREAAKKLEAAAGPQYQNFVKGMSKLYTAGERMGKFKAAFGGKARVLGFADQIASEADTLRKVMGKQGDDIVNSVNATMRKMSKYADEIDEIKTAAKNTAEGISDAKAARIAEINAKADAELAKLNGMLAANGDAINAASNVLNMPTGEFTATIARATPGSREALAEVARGAVADTAGQSTTGAVRTAKALAEPATYDRLAQVVGKQEAKKLQTMGRLQSQAARNLSELAPPRTSEQFPDEAVTAALEMIAVPGAGAASRSNILKRLFERGQALGMTNKMARETAKAITSGDEAVLRELMFGIKRNQMQRAIAQDMVRSLALERGNSTTEAMQGRQ